MNWLLRGLLALGLGLVLWILVAAAATIHPLNQQDCQVMQEHLRHEGHRVQVESGVLVMSGNKVVAVLECRTENGQVAFTWAYPLGPLDRHPALEKTP